MFKEGGIGVKGRGGVVVVVVLHTPALQRPVTNHMGQYNQIIPRQRAFSVHMCSHKEPRKLQGLVKFPQAGKAVIHCAHSLLLHCCRGSWEDREQKGGGGGGASSIDPTALFFSGGKFASLLHFLQSLLVGYLY